ncbi:MAG: M20/M25/M40 family metallo-hydrolase [Thermoplasmata archaeon]|nr:M20/M25/M40 family metallo-hydrolase [Thermoplasmata archaeon]
MGGQGSSTPVSPETDLNSARDLLASLVSISPTNLEDPAHGRYEKPNYSRAADQLVRTARRFGLATRVFDPLTALPDPKDLRHALPSPNVIVDLDVGAASTVLILAHYDVVPVPAEQLGRWKSPPHVLTMRDDGRWYGRGANDDLGSGVVASLLAMKHLAEGAPPPHNVRLLICCDEETGGSGGVESLRIHDEALPDGDPGRFLLGDVALIPDGSDHATAGSSGVAFLDASFVRPVSVREVLDLGEALVRLHERVRLHRSRYPSPDWPDHGAPEPVITGRATVTQFDLSAPGRSEETVALRSAHAESDAANQIPEAVTLVFAGPMAPLAALPGQLSSSLGLPFHLGREVRSSLVIPPDSLAVQVVGQSAHAGYPHRGHNPVPAALALLRRAVEARWVAPSQGVTATFSVDLRLVPEAPLLEGRAEALDAIRGWASEHCPDARLEAPEGRSRGGYTLPIDDPRVVRLERLLRTLVGGGGVFGEYGGTDASSLATIRTPSGSPLPAMVFGSMDRAAHIHEAEESVDPKMLLGISETIRRFVLDE